METQTTTDRIMGKITEIVKSLGGLLNPFLWGAILVVILVGQSWAVKLFVLALLGLSIYFRWFYGENNILKVRQRTEGERNE